MKLSKLLEQELQEPTPSIPVVDLANINRNIDEYMKYEADFVDDQREEFLQTIIRMMQTVSRKMAAADNKYDSFIRRLYDKENTTEVLTKIKKYNTKIIQAKGETE